MTPDKKTNLAELYKTWSKEKLLDAVGPHHDDYESDAIELIFQELRRRNIPEDAIISAQSIPREIPPAPSGIGGWLLFFVIIMGLNSLYLAYIGLTTFLDPKKPSNFVPLLAAGIGGYGLFALFHLITFHESAPVHAKRWIASLFGFNILLTFLNGIQTPVVMNAIHSALWFQYFSTSRRVEATYSAESITTVSAANLENRCINCESPVEPGNKLCLKCADNLSE